MTNRKFKEFYKLRDFIYSKLKTEHITDEYLEIIKKYDCDKHTIKKAEETFLKYWNYQKIKNCIPNEHRTGFILVNNLRRFL